MVRHISCNVNASLERRIGSICSCSAPSSRSIQSDKVAKLGSGLSMPDRTAKSAFSLRIISPTQARSAGSMVSLEKTVPQKLQVFNLVAEVAGV